MSSRRIKKDHMQQRNETRIVECEREKEEEEERKKKERKKEGKKEGRKTPRIREGNRRAQTTKECVHSQPEMIIETCKESRQGVTTGVEQALAAPMAGLV